MKVDDDILEILSRAAVTGNELRLVGQLDPKTYARTNKVLVAAGGSWNRKAGAHVFSDDVEETIEQIVLSGEIARPQDFGVFLSPPPVANRVIELANLRAGLDVLEPNAGKGALASRALLLGCNVDCVELLKAHVDILCSTPYRQVVHADFLTLPQTPRYDRVVMNPPFGKQMDIKHVRHALGFLKPRGLLVSVMAASVAFRDNKLTQDFRDLLRQNKGDIEALPEGAFKDSGTSVRSVIATIPNAR